MSVQTNPAQTGQFVTLYDSLAGFDDEVALRVSMPRLAIAGAEDRIGYEPRWGGVTVRMAEPLVRRRAELEASSWSVVVLPGLDHMGAMRSEHALPILRDWLSSVAPRSA